MIALISKDEESSLELSLTTKSFLVDGGDRLILSDQNTIDIAGEWIGMHGVSQVYFNPLNETEEFNAFMFVEYDDAIAIRLYHKTTK